MIISFLKINSTPDDNWITQFSAMGLGNEIKLKLRLPPFLFFIVNAAKSAI